MDDFRKALREMKQAGKRDPVALQMSRETADRIAQKVPMVRDVPRTSTFHGIVLEMNDALPVDTVVLVTIGEFGTRNFSGLFNVGVVK
jgi:hypothetical protein